MTHLQVKESNIWCDHQARPAQTTEEWMRIWFTPLIHMHENKSISSEKTIHATYGEPGESAKKYGIPHQGMTHLQVKESNFIVIIKLALRKQLKNGYESGSSSPCGIDTKIKHIIY